MPSLNIGLPPAQRILVLAPHPDDESLSCGGTIAHYVRNGAVVSLLVFSDGAAIEEPDGQQADVVAAREREMATATTILGLQQVQTVGLPDGHLTSHTVQVHEAIQQQLVTFQPDLVLAPSPMDGHADHATVGRMALHLFRHTPGWALAFYEGLTPVRFNTLVEITEVAAIKEKAIRCYQRSLFQQPELFWEAFRALNLAKSAFVHRLGLFESLWVLHAPLTDDEMIEWTTYGFQPHDKGQFTLRSVQQSDELLFALQEQATALTHIQHQYDTLQRQHAELQRQVHAPTPAAHASQHVGDEHERAVPILHGRRFSALRSSLRHYVEQVCPTGSPQRVLLRAIKRQLTQYTSKSPSE